MHARKGSNIWSTNEGLFSPAYGARGAQNEARSGTSRARRALVVHTRLMRRFVLLSVVVCGCSSSSSPSAGASAADAAPPDAFSMPLDANGESDARPAMDAKPDGASCKLHAPYSSKNTLCNGCAQENCCPEVNACLDDTRCNDDYVNCELACALLPDDAGADASAAAAACLANCGGNYPEGKGLWDRAIGCVDSRCASECK